VGLTATSSSGLESTFTSLSTKVCTIARGSTSLSGDTTTATITVSTAGTCKIEATQAGNTTYAAAAPQTLSFTVSK
jgi:hypothetical protein